MKTSDVISLTAFASFGIWMLLAPRSVIRFYAWFPTGTMRKAPMPRTLTIRIIGLAWSILVVSASLWQIAHRI